MGDDDPAAGHRPPRAPPPRGCPGDRSRTRPAGNVPVPRPTSVRRTTRRIWRASGRPDLLARVRSPADRCGRSAASASSSKARRWTVELAVDGRVGGQTGEQQMGGGHEGGDALRPGAPRGESRDSSTEAEPSSTPGTRWLWRSVKGGGFMPRRCGNVRATLVLSHPLPGVPVTTARRTHGFRESVIRGMTRLAREHNSLNLAQGFPNFPAPDALKEAAVRAIRDGHQPVRHHLGRAPAPHRAGPDLRRSATGWTPIRSGRSPSPAAPPRR